MPQSWSVVAIFKEGRPVPFPLSQQTEGRASRLCHARRTENIKSKSTFMLDRKWVLTMDTLPVTYHRKPERTPKGMATSEDGGCADFNITGKGKIEDRLLRLISGEYECF